MEVVTLKNRTSQKVEGMWDGRPYTVPAFAAVALPVIVAEAIKRQNVVMGSEDPYTGEMDYLVAIVEHHDDESPIEQTRAITRMNRSNREGQDIIVKGIGGMYSPKDRRDASPIGSIGPVMTNFTKP